jgi:site-specific DNA-methyltransferase (adenine-specific)
MIITSPPYKDCDGFSMELIHDVFSQCFRILKKDSICWVNFGHMAHEKEKPFRVALELIDIGFDLHETFIWSKNHYRPLQGKRRVNNLTEYVFQFNKGKCPELDRLSVGVKYKDKSNIKRWKGTEGRDVKCGGNIWNIPYETIRKKGEKLHNDRFPIGLPLNCLRLGNVKVRENPMVLDPFGGSGTTALACQTEGVSCTSIEKNKDFYDISIERLCSDEIGD